MTTTMSLVFMTQFSTKMDSIVHSSEIMFMYTNLTRQWTWNWLHMDKVSWWMKSYFHGWMEHTNAIMGEMSKMAWIKSILKSEIDHDGI